MAERTFIVKADVEYQLAKFTTTSDKRKIKMPLNDYIHRIELDFSCYTESQIDVVLEEVLKEKIKEKCILIRKKEIKVTRSFENDLDYKVMKELREERKGR